MNRRSAMQWLARIFGSISFTSSPAWPQPVSFPGGQSQSLRDLAKIVLPSDSGKSGSEGIAVQFERYVREYRPGADTEHGYGFTRVRPKPPSPAAEYMKQLAALPAPLTREAVEAALEAAQIKELPRLPEGKNVIVDLMSFYFRSSDANDLCYQAAIQRETCRGLQGSGNAPAPLRVSH